MIIRGLIAAIKALCCSSNATIRWLLLVDTFHKAMQISSYTKLPPKVKLHDKSSEKTLKRQKR